MRIQKYLHSCLLLEEGGKKLLIDPGAFSFIEGNTSPKDIGPVDAILISHEHTDHYFPEALKEFCAMKPTKIIAPKWIMPKLEEEGLTCQVIEEGDTLKVAGFSIEAFESSHERLPKAGPGHLGFMINSKLFFPGDSFSLQSVENCEVLALPISGPFLTLVDALEYAHLIGPKKVIPVHDGILKDFYLERIHKQCKEYLAEKEIDFLPLKLGESTDI